MRPNPRELRRALPLRQLNAGSTTVKVSLLKQSRGQTRKGVQRYPQVIDQARRPRAAFMNQTRYLKAHCHRRYVTHHLASLARIFNEK